MKLFGDREETIFLNVAKNLRVPNHYNFFSLSKSLFGCVTVVTPMLFRILILVNVTDSFLSMLSVVAEECSMHLLMLMDYRINKPAFLYILLLKQK